MLLRIENGPTLAVQSLDELHAHQDALSAIYPDGRVRCTCEGGVRELVLCRRIDPHSHRVLYYLRSHAGEQHESTCLYGADDVEQAKLLPEPAHVARAFERPAEERPPVPLLDLLQLLWMRAQLTRDDPPQVRSWEHVRSALWIAARDFATPRGRLCDTLVVIPARPTNAQISPFVRSDLDFRFRQAQAQRHRIPIIGELGEPLAIHTATHRLFMKGLQLASGWHLEIDQQCALAATQHYAAANALFGKDGARLIACVLAQPQAKTHALLVDRIALMAVSHRFMPITSDAELARVNDAASQGRRYEVVLAIGHDLRQSSGPATSVITPSAPMAISSATPAATR